VVGNTRYIQSFQPLAGPGAKILILGSMPGIASLEAGQYYAHSRNAFWPIMGDVFGAQPSLSYEARRSILINHGVAVWDVLKLCRREGSLDSNIRDEVPNDFAKFFEMFPRISRVLLNGGTAARSYGKYVQPLVPELRALAVPSTSPAYAAMRYGEKLGRWRYAILKTGPALIP